MMIKRIIVLIFILLFSVMFISNSVRRITNGEWAPWLSENLKHYGLASHIVSEAFAYNDIQVVYGFFPWSRSYEIARVGEWDGSIVWSKTEERAEYFYYSDPVLYTQTVFFHRKDLDFDWETYADLKDYTIGITLGYTYRELDQYIDNPEYKFDPAPNDETNFRKLIAGRIDIFPVSLDIGYETMRNIFNELQIAEITHNQNPIDEVSYHLILTKVKDYNKDFIEMFNEGLKMLIESGKYDQYIQDSFMGLYELE